MNWKCLSCNGFRAEARRTNAHYMKSTTTPCSALLIGARLTPGVTAGRARGQGPFGPVPGDGGGGGSGPGGGSGVGGSVCARFNRGAIKALPNEPVTSTGCNGCTARSWEISLVAPDGIS